MNNNTATPAPILPREFTARTRDYPLWEQFIAGGWKIRVRLEYGGVDPWKSWTPRAVAVSHSGETKEEYTGTYVPNLLFKDAAEEWYRGEEFGAQAFLAGALRSAPRNLRRWYKGVACHPSAKRVERNRALRAVAYHLGVSRAHAGWHAPHSLVNVAVAAGYRPSTPRPLRHEVYPDLVAGWEVVLD